MMVRTMIFLGMLSLSWVALAGTLYQWKDAMGHMHFTDDISKVPVEYRSSSSREMKPLKPASEGVTEIPGVLNGRALYESKCAACHVMGYVDDGAREGLAWAVIDQTTHYPHTQTDLFNKLRSIVDGSIDMPIIEINDDELKAIADYLIKKALL